MKVLIVDDDQIVAMSLKTILEADSEIEVCGCGSDGEDAVSSYKEMMPDVLLMDIQMKNISGLEAAKRIIADYPEARILLLTTFSDDEYIINALEIGVKGYILKQDFDGIVLAIKAVYRGQSVFGGEIVSRIPVLKLSKSEFDAAAYDLCGKELDIIAQVGLGKSNKEIADYLFLSEGTVRNYISVILEKLSLRDRTQLAVFYLTKMC